MCKLLNNVRGRDELEIVLNKTGKETEEKYERLARLDLAIKYEEKPVSFQVIISFSILFNINNYLSFSLLLTPIVNKSLWKYGLLAYEKCQK